MKDQIIEAAEVKGRGRSVYCIGSFGSRVNFHAQQNRALNLAWALHADKQIEAGDQIAVIGGGVTGLTAAAALISLGCRVDIYETGAERIPRQRGTQHRLVHPTINSWPKRAPEVTTKLPFMEWHVGQCDLVVKNLVSQFEKLRESVEGGKPESERSRFLAGCAAHKVVGVATNLVMVKSDLKEDLTYRLAIIAVGFGRETPLPPFDTKEYWYPDGLETERDGNDHKYYVVSGCGDGGLIDALRVVHVDFEMGMIAFHTAAELFGTDIARDIEKAESSAAADIAHHIKKAKTLTAADPDASKLEASYKTVASKLEVAYSKTAETLFKDHRYKITHRRLVDSLTKFRHLVYLMDKTWEPPFSPYAAPIHKLLVAHAKRYGRVDYVTGPLIEVPGNLKAGYTILPREPETKVIIRHGSNVRRVLQQILSEFEIDDLEERQRGLSDHVVDPLWTPQFFRVGEDIPSHDPNSEEFIKHRRRLAESALHWIDKQAKLTRVVGGYEVTFPGEVPSILHGKLFGIATKAISRPVTGGLR